MPEILEVESYRQLALTTVDRRIRSVGRVDPHLLRRGLDPVELVATLEGVSVSGVRRHGKLLLVETDAGRVLGLHFGMTGRLEVDGRFAIERLEYASPRTDPSWVRLEITFADGGALALHDQRRFGAIELDPVETDLGPDAFGLTARELREALGSSRAPLKARLLDQHRIAGLGNLLVDEILWRASLAPTRPAGGLARADLGRLLRHLHETLVELGERGGSHCGDFQHARIMGSDCPRDGSPIRREAVGGRTTYWCPAHQRGAAAGETAPGPGR